MESAENYMFLSSFFAHVRRKQKVVGTTYILSLFSISLHCQTQKIAYFFAISLSHTSLVPNSLLPTTVQGHLQCWEFMSSHCLKSRALLYFTIGV